jgi:ABC-type glutathione transport system ATPase component
MIAPRAPVLRVDGLVKHFVQGGGLRGPRAVVHAIDGVSFDVAAGETLGLVGESGSGKTTLGRTVLRLYEPTAGRVIFDGADLRTLPPPALRQMRQHMQMIFQDPVGSLNPRLTVEDIVAEPLDIHHLAASRADRRAGPTNFPVASASASASPARWPRAHVSSSPTSRSPPWTFPSRRRS